jgi:hypothetical protein
MAIVYDPTNYFPRADNGTFLSPRSSWNLPDINTSNHDIVLARLLLGQGANPPGNDNAVGQFSFVQNTGSPISEYPIAPNIFKQGFILFSQNVNFTLFPGAKVEFSAWIRALTGQTWNNLEARWLPREAGDLPAGIIQLARVDAQPVDSEWRQVYLQIENTTGGNVALSRPQFTLINETLTNIGGNVNDLNALMIDTVQWRFFTETVPVCNPPVIQAVNVTDPSGPGDTDGQIEIIALGTPDRYSIEAGGANPQTSPIFSGLTAGTYYPRAWRTTDEPDCFDESDPVTLVDEAATLDFTAAAFDETVQGQSDGRIEVTVTVATTAPYSYSKDGGLTFQASNIFTDLAPGTYPITVRDSGAGPDVTKNVTIAAGTVQFSDFYFSGNPIVFPVAASANRFEANYRRYLEVQVQQPDGSYQKEVAFEIAPDENQESRFIVNRSFDGILTTQPPVAGSTQVKTVSDRVKTFKVRYGDLFDQLTLPTAFTESNPYQVIRGGISKEQFPTLQYLSDYLPTNKKFLTWKPDQETVARNQEEFLFFLVYATTVSALRVRYRLHYTDETTADHYKTTDAGSQAAQPATYGEIYEIPAGVENAGLDLVTPAKTLYKYEVTVLNQSGAEISESRTFFIQTINAKNTRFLMFENSLGGYDTIRLEGRRSKAAEISSEQIRKNLTDTYDAEDFELESSDLQLRQRYQYSTGFLKKNGEARVEWLQDLLRSTRIYEVTSKTRIPLILRPGSFPVAEDDLFEYFQRFSADNAFIERYYTPAI